MELIDALDSAERNENVQKLRSFFLGSGFASISAVTTPLKPSAVKEWTLLYYNPVKKCVVDCSVSEKVVTVGVETPAIREMGQLDLSKVKRTLQEALATAEGRVKKKPLNVLISLHTKDVGGKSYTVWTIAFVTSDMSVTSVDVDASTGKILKEETTRLVKRL